MSRLDALRKNFRDTRYLRTLKRAFDDRPVQCSLYVTDRCNLDCAYCTEYDNTRPHPKLADIRRWLDHIARLGTVRVALVGGEPMMHPDIVEIVRHAREVGLATSLTTNGFLLTADRVARLEDAGLEVMQMSIDRMTPSAITRKSLKSVAKKIDLVAASGISLHITGVICADTIGESMQVLDYGLARGIPTEVRLVHADPEQVMRVDPGAREALRATIDTMLARKKRGERIHTTAAMLHYQRDLIDGRNTAESWTCAAGYKLFFVSAAGKFMECSMRPTNRDLEDMTVADLKGYFRKKSCQTGCGVYCAVSMSMFRDRPVSFVAPEIAPRLRQAFNDLKPA